jgi:hypothetical protein
MLDDPRSWVDSPNSIVPVDIAHMYTTIPSEGIKEKVIRSAKDISQILA